jgi:hypothetical protein
VRNAKKTKEPNGEDNQLEPEVIVTPIKVKRGDESRATLE